MNPLKRNVADLTMKTRHSCFFLFADIPLSTFLNFNKIKTLTLAIEDIQKAVESSEMLELSDDKLTVRRTTDIKKKDDIDECVIYIVCSREDSFILF